MERCPICYHIIHIGIKQLECHPSHYICITCFCQDRNYYRCCMCRRVTDAYVLFSRKQNKTVASFNELSENVEAYLSALNQSRQLNVPIQNLVNIKHNRNLYSYFNSSIDYISLFQCFLYLFISAGIIYVFIISEYVDTITIVCYTNNVHTLCKAFDYYYVFLIARFLYILAAIGTIGMVVLRSGTIFIKRINPFKMHRIALNSY